MSHNRVTIKDIKMRLAFTAVPVICLFALSACVHRTAQISYEPPVVEAQAKQEPPPAAPPIAAAPVDTVTSATIAPAETVIFPPEPPPSEAPPPAPVVVDQAPPDIFAPPPPPAAETTPDMPPPAIAAAPVTAPIETPAEPVSSPPPPPPEPAVVISTPEFKPMSVREVFNDIYGPPPPQDYKSIVKEELSGDFFTNMVFGSTAPIFEFAPPVKARTQESRLLNTRQVAGWAVCGTIDRKDKFGGYAAYSGRVPFFVLFKNGRIVGKLIGQRPADDDDLGRANPQIAHVCAGTEKKTSRQ
jgi:hypothetical protein